MATNNKYIRIELMVEEDDKTLLEEASACKGVSLNHYIIDAGDERCERGYGKRKAACLIFV